ncbi:uncharacterized protein LOC131229571 [Magnolia sinica]|uniref:uncharacterized protein LOC131229571 n=1 Tax=Magnolia sinica TaxID=86752 RepID=UPI002659F254|nr:uncharacterized protein LOC131229571 [Magnolia sinica]
MGSCHSCESTSVATAKLILQDGKLQEFSYPVKASHVLQTDPTCFICNSDEMEFDDLLPAINADEELQPGQLYFALPLSRLRHPLQAEEMAALAVKASAALRKSCGDRCGCRRRRAVAPVVFRREEGCGARRGVAEEKKRVGRGSGRNFASKLNAIPE